MAKIKIPCPGCGHLLQCDERYRGRKVKCPHCKSHVPVPQIFQARTAPRSGWNKKRLGLTTAGIFLLATVATVAWACFFQSVCIRWDDRRPVGVLFLASNYHASVTNPRGWFNDPGLNFTGPDGVQRFRTALLDYTDRSLAILKRTGAQGVIVWDLEGEQFPHKTSFIGDPRALDRLAPEMAVAADEFFSRLRAAGLRVGVTIRPQKLVVDEFGQPSQTFAFNLESILLEKIDYARKRWGATLFYVDSNDGLWRPDELWQLRRVARQRPDILLIPEHHGLPYAAFSAPYVSLRKGAAATTGKWSRKFFPGSFQALDISDCAADWAEITAAQSNGDILLFRAWIWSPECDLLEALAGGKK
jgi:hypothetical protein